VRQRQLDKIRRQSIYPALRAIQRITKRRRNGFCLVFEALTFFLSPLRRFLAKAGRGGGIFTQYYTTDTQNFFQ
jgi:hypothetical protein